MKKKELEAEVKRLTLINCRLAFFNYRLAYNNKKIKEAMTEFVERCEAGSIRSIKTYCKFKRILDEVK